MDLVLRLREMRRLSRLCQEEVARRSGVGVKTLSSFETGERIESMKVSQLQRILRVYGSTESQFFGSDIEALFGNDLPAEVLASAQKLNALPSHVRRALVERIELMIDAACLAIGVETPRPTDSAMPRGGRYQSSVR